MRDLRNRFSGDGVKARAMRSAVWSVAGGSGQQILRLISNLVLTRLLFPEAFGLMALVTVVMGALELFSDSGVRESVIQNARGDDPDFLDTAFTVQVLRGLLLWVMTIILAHPMAALYDAPELAQILPVAGLGIVLQSLSPTKTFTMNRRLVLGRLTRVKLANQAVTLVITALLAWYFRSVWALVIGNLIGSALLVGAQNLLIPGRRNRFRFERDAFWQLFHFGKWIFASTAAGFLINQGDRAILGLYISLEMLGIYGIGYFLASAPLMIGRTMQTKVIFPIYRMKPPSESQANRSAIFRARRLVAGSLVTVTVLLAFSGPPLVSFLYDPRYLQAGPILTLVCLSIVPAITLNSVGLALLGTGDSRRSFYVIGLTAFLQTTFLFTGIQIAGLFGAILAPGLALLASYPQRFILARRAQVWDPVQDIWFTLFGLTLCILACVLHRDAIAVLLTSSVG